MGLFQMIGQAIGRSAGEKAVKDLARSGELGAMVKNAAKASVDRFLDSDEFVATIDRIVREQVAKPEYAWFRFVKMMQARLHEVDRNLSPSDGYRIALLAYKGFLHDEKIKFGDPRYTWDRGGAIDLIQAYEIDHWEAKS